MILRDSGPVFTFLCVNDWPRRAKSEEPVSLQADTTNLLQPMANKSAPVDAIEPFGRTKHM